MEKCAKWKFETVLEKVSEYADRAANCFGAGYVRIIVGGSSSLPRLVVRVGVSGRECERATFFQDVDRMFQVLVKQRSTQLMI